MDRRDPAYQNVWMTGSALPLIAIDGPSGVGKSTTARRGAERLGWQYLDTGAMYRAAALAIHRAGISLEDRPSLERLLSGLDLAQEGGRMYLAGEDVSEAIRTPEVSQAASRVSTIGGVRRAMVEEQRRMAAQASVVMEGRDIGTVVFPNADIKIFLDADQAVRADRRVREVAETGARVDSEEMARQIRERDQRDRTRLEAPLVQAPDAIYVDSTGLTIDQVEETILRIIRERTSNGKERTS